MKEYQKLKQAKEYLEDYIRSNGMRMTPVRLSILEAVFAFDTPYTIDQMKEYLDEVYLVARETIFNNLELFFRIGIVLKRPIGSGAVEYETCFETQTRHHLVCKMCGQIFEFRDASIEQYFSEKRYRKFKMSNCSVTIYGLCSRCQNKIKRERRKKQKQMEVKYQTDNKRKSQK